MVFSLQFDPNCYTTLNDPSTDSLLTVYLPNSLNPFRDKLYKGPSSLLTALTGTVTPVLNEEELLHFGGSLFLLFDPPSY